MRCDCDASPVASELVSASVFRPYITRNLESRQMSRGYIYAATIHIDRSGDPGQLPSLNTRTSLDFMRSFPIDSTSRKLSVFHAHIPYPTHSRCCIAIKQIIHFIPFPSLHQRRLVSPSTSRTRRQPILAYRSTCRVP